MRQQWKKLVTSFQVRARIYMERQTFKRRVRRQKEKQSRLPIEYITFLPDRNEKRLSTSFLIVIVGMCIYGLVLPHDWEQRWGIIAQPILWAVQMIPSIEKFAVASSIPELVKGFTGFAALIIPCHTIYLFRWAFFHFSEKDNPQIILAYLDKSVFKNVLAFIFSAFIIYIFYYMPFSVSDLIGTAPNSPASSFFIVFFIIELRYLL